MSTSTASAGAGSYATPTKKAAFANPSTNAEPGPSRARPLVASPAYSSRRHSLYGIEDRIVIEPGSRSWKVGYSGEVDPRAVFEPLEISEEGEAWDLDLSDMEPARRDRAEAKRLVGVRVLKQLRATYIKHLMTDPKARKVIVVESTYLPSYVKDEIAKSLFEHLKVPSVSFTPASVLALAACGRITGLVLDSGWLETTVTPVYHSRPLFHLSRSTPLAGRRLHRRLRALLRHHAKYYPPPISFSNLSRPLIQPIPLEVLTENLITRIIRQGCFLGNPVAAQIPISTEEDDPMSPNLDEMDDPRLMDYLKARYMSGADATDLRISIPAQPHETQGMGPAMLVVPGWVRERAAEVLFDDEGSEAENMQDLILQCIMKLPIDLRPVMISSILVVGGTPSLPGFIPRLRTSLLQSLTSIMSTSASGISPPPLHSPEYRMAEIKSWRKRHHEPYKELYPLRSKLAILNDPSPLDGEVDGGSKGGSAPRWSCGLMSWVGGSLAGALKIGGPEILREEYDAHVQSHLERGEIYRQRLAEEATTVSQLLAKSTESDSVDQDMGVVPPPQLSVGQSQAEVGIQIEHLLPGMAIGGELQRKRGWNVDLSVGDWSRVITT